MEKIQYLYTNNKVPNEKIDYSYSKFYGFDFLKAWLESRTQCASTSKDEEINDNKVLNLLLSAGIENSTDNLFNLWLNSYLSADILVYEKEIHLLLKRFEVTKRIYGEYSQDFRPVVKDNYSELTNYLKFGTLLVLMHAQVGQLQFVNALLKLMDILCSISTVFSEIEKIIFNWLILKEQIIIKELMGKLAIDYEEKI